MGKLTCGYVAAISSFTVLVGCTHGLLAAQRLLTSYCYPATLLAFALGWLALFLLYVRRERSLGFILLGILAFYLIAANAYVCNAVFASLESPFYHVRPVEGPVYDAVLVLGGGVSLGIDGKTGVLNGAGDRLLVAARMYHTGRTRQIVLFGSANKSKGANARSEAELSAEILAQFAVPAEALVLSQGEYTREEITNGAEVVRQQKFQRVGLITSAWHLPRAMRLAKKAGLECEPLPADFRSGRVEWRPDFWLPSGRALGDVAFATKEYLAQLTSR